MCNGLETLELYCLQFNDTCVTQEIGSKEVTVTAPIEPVYDTGDEGELQSGCSLFWLHLYQHHTLSCGFVLHGDNGKDYALAELPVSEGDLIMDSDFHKKLILGQKPTYH